MSHHGYKPTRTFEFCESCAIAKAKAKPIAKTNYNFATKPGKKLLLDLEGPFLTTRNGSEYHLGIIDNYSFKEKAF